MSEYLGHSSTAIHHIHSVFSDKVALRSTRFVPSLPCRLPGHSCTHAICVPPIDMYNHETLDDEDLEFSRNRTKEISKKAVFRGYKKVLLPPRKAIVGPLREFSGGSETQKRGLSWAVGSLPFFHSSPPSTEHGKPPLLHFITSSSFVSFGFSYSGFSFSASSFNFLL